MKRQTDQKKNDNERTGRSPLFQVFQCWNTHIIQSGIYVLTFKTETAHVDIG